MLPQGATKKSVYFRMIRIETPHANLKQTMQDFNTSYTVYVNKRHRRVGHLGVD
jgi:hypothetical protein